MIPMLRELVVWLLVAGVGVVTAPRSWGSPRRLAAAVPVGVAAVSVVELAILSTGAAVGYPWVALVVTVVAAAVGAVRRRPALDGWDVRHVAVFGALLVATVLVTAAVPVVNVTADSFRTTTTAGMLATDGSVGAVSGYLLLTRSLVLGLFHGLADPTIGYLRAFGPLVALSLLAVVGDLVTRELRGVGSDGARLVATGAVLVLLTNHWFVFNALYLNGHVLFACWLLLAAVVLRDVVIADGVERRHEVVIAALLCVGLVVLRPEGAIIAGVVLAPFVLESSVPRRLRGLAMVVVGVGIVAWHAAVVLPVVGLDDDQAGNVLVLTVVGLLLVVAPVLLSATDRFQGRRPLVWLHLAAWLAVVVMTVRDPGVLYYSAIATVRNVTSDGLWGVSLWVLALLLVVVLATRRVARERFLVFPLLTFVPLGLLLAFLRGIAYRIGPGDSLNRMLLHVVPLAIVLVALGTDGEPRGRLVGGVVGRRRGRR